MSDMIENSRGQVWRDLRPQGMLLPEEECTNISIASIYTGPRPAYVPKAEPFGIFAVRANSHALQKMVTSFQHEPGQTSPYIKQEDHMTMHSEFCGQQSFSSDTSIISFSHESQDPTSPEPSPHNAPSPPNAHQRIKGQCFLCAKVDTTQEKETCLVCSAKYCGSCVLKAMGSMPEGRKCVQCIGKPVSEEGRLHLGKSAKLLGRLLSVLELRQIMKSEKDCSANQLKPEQLYVNGKQLTSKEFAELLGCSNPPSRLKPGRYWYDGHCGYWGKEGEKPEKIITVNLKVGGDLQEKASAGCTQVYINNREITRIELKALQFAGVQCSPQTRLLLNQDGSYQQEVQNHCAGNIWEKATTRFIYHFFALPTPNFRAVTPETSPRPVPAYLEPRATHKVLFLGHPGCGSSTILKQAKFLHEDKFTPKELQDIKVSIQRNICKYLLILLEARDHFEEEENARIRESEENTPSTSAQRELGDSGHYLQRNGFTMASILKEQADWFVQKNASGFLENHYSALFQNHASLIEEFWKEPSIQATYERRAELHTLPDVAGDFLSRVVEISANDYIPTDNDILRAQGGTHDSGLAEVQFSIDEDGATSGAYYENYDEGLANGWYHLIRLSGTSILDTSNLNKLLKMFDDIQALIFCVGLDTYDQMWLADEKSPPQNRMLMSRDLFETIFTHPNFKDKPSILFLNKYDLFVQKIETVPLTSCEWFSDFHPAKIKKPTPQRMAEQAYTYVAQMFKKYFKMVNPNGGKLHTFQLNSLDRPTVGIALQYVRDVLVWEELKKRGFPSTSIYTSETSSEHL